VIRALPALVVSAVACSGARPVPCHGTTCPTGEECIAHRCVESHSEPVPSGSSRVVLQPARAAVVTRAAQRAHLPAVATLGSHVDGGTRWFLAFDGDWENLGEVANAFLVFERAPGGSGIADVEVTVWTVQGEWKRDTLTWASRPAFGPPAASGLARALPDVPLRIDVTALVRYMARANGAHGFVLVSEETEGHGANYFTGAAGGTAPRLEIYVR
jgi:hypothetical protein